MGCFDGLIATGLHENENGELRFYPYGRWGKAYKVETEEQSDLIKNEIKYYHLTIIVFIGVSSVIGSIFGLNNIPYLVLSLIFLFAVYIIYTVVTFRRTTHGLVPTGERLSRAAQRRAMAVGFGVRTLTFYLILSLVAIPVGVLLYSPEYPYAAWLLIGWGCIFSTIIFLRLRVALKAKRDEGTAA